MTETELVARLERLEWDPRRLKWLMLSFVMAASVLLAVPVFAQKAHYG